MTSASLSVVCSLVMIFHFSTTRLLSTNKQLLSVATFAIFVSHLFIAIGFHGGWPERFCVAEGIIIVMFGLVAISYTSLIAVSTYQNLVLLRQTKSSVRIVGHVVAWTVSIVLTMFFALHGSHEFVSDWSGWCFVAGKSVAHVVFLSYTLIVVAFDLVMSVLVIRGVHNTMSTALQHLAPGTRPAVEARVVGLILVTFGVPFVFHAALYINELLLPTSPSLALFVLDAMFTYSCGFLLCVAVLSNKGSRKELLENARQFVTCGRYTGVDDDDSQTWDSAEYQHVDSE